MRDMIDFILCVLVIWLFVIVQEGSFKAGVTKMIQQTKPAIEWVKKAYNDSNKSQ